MHENDGLEIYKEKNWQKQKSIKRYNQFTTRVKHFLNTLLLASDDQTKICQGRTWRELYKRG